MVWQRRGLTPSFGMELSGQSLGPGLPLGEMTAVYDAVVEDGVVVVKGQSLSDKDFADFASSIGQIVPLPMIDGLERSQVTLFGNIDREGEFQPEESIAMQGHRTALVWHIDNSYLRPRATLSMLYGLVVPPEGGNTEFCDLRLAWEALPAAEQASLERLTARHWLIRTLRNGGIATNPDYEKRYPPVRRPLVHVHPETGRKTLCIAYHIDGIDGMEDEAAQALVAELTEWATAPERCYSHRWSPGDLLIWDNRSVMHRATRYDIHKHKRDVRSLRLNDLADA
jgi:alpha-ketoglutarate-dependent 2,4-dichlorophenoxyacetate dioxygenase